MTLADLIRKAKEIGDQFNTYEIPLYDEAYDEIPDVEFIADKDEDGYFIKMTVSGIKVKDVAPEVLRRFREMKNK